VELNVREPVETSNLALTFSLNIAQRPREPRDKMQLSATSRLRKYVDPNALVEDYYAEEDAPERESAEDTEDAERLATTELAAEREDATDTAREESFALDTELAD
jgi:hypothetical protein